MLNLSILKQNVLNRNAVLNHVGLCGFSALYALISFLMVLNLSFEMKLVLIHFMWISGSLISYYYIYSVKNYLQDNTKNLIHISKLPLISAVGAGASLIVWGLTGNCYFLSSEVPSIQYNNLYMNQIGGFNPSILVKLLSSLIFISTLYSSFYILKLILTSEEKNKVLIIGIVLTFVAFMIDVSISFTDPYYLVPIMFLANIFEINRITQFNQMELGRKLQGLTKELIQTSKLSEAGNYFALLAHEIMNPLQAVKAYFHKLTNGNDQLLDDSSQKSIAIINKELDRIERLAKNVKKYIKVNDEQEMVSSDLALIINDSTEMIHLRAYYAGVTIKVKHSETLLFVRVIPDQLIQVFTNLLSNAVEALNGLEKRWIEISYQQDLRGDKVIISIKDSGKGILPELQTKIWENRFTTKTESGTGLGLGICRRIISNQSGNLYLNTKSPYTEFIIELPLAKSS